MNPIYIIVFILLATFIIWQLSIFLKSKRSVGKVLPFDDLDSELRVRLEDRVGLLYFFSQTCHNCKKQTLIIEKIKNDYENIIFIDVSKNINTARILNIMGTPSIIFFGRNKILGHYVGVKSESFILDKLENSQ